MSLSRVEITEGGSLGPQHGRRQRSAWHELREVLMRTSTTLHVMPAEVLLTCTTHAMTTEAEEIMGLLLGDILVGGEGLKGAGMDDGGWGASPRQSPA